MPEIEYREFAAKLPRTENRRRLIKRVGAFSHICRWNGAIRFARKGSDLVEIVEVFTRQRTSPVVDKKSGFVFGVPEGCHEQFRGLLYECNSPEDAGAWGGSVNARNYITAGCGYYISSMQPGVIVCGEKYKEDRWDKDLFLMLNVFRDSVGR